MLAAFAVTVPALPAALVETEIFPPSARVSEVADTVTWPAFPAPPAVLRRPLPDPLIVTAPVAWTPRLPAAPGVPRSLLVVICAPLLRLTEPAFTCTPAALPKPFVFVLMKPPFITKRDAETSTLPLLISSALLEILAPPEMVRV